MKAVPSMPPPAALDAAELTRRRRSAGRLAWLLAALAVAAYAGAMLLLA